MSSEKAVEGNGRTSQVCMSVIPPKISIPQDFSAVVSWSVSSLELVRAGALHGHATSLIEADVDLFCRHCCQLKWPWGSGRVLLLDPIPGVSQGSARRSDKAAPVATTRNRVVGEVQREGPHSPPSPSTSAPLSVHDLARVVRRRAAPLQNRSPCS